MFLSKMAHVSIKNGTRFYQKWHMFPSKMALVSIKNGTCFDKKIEVVSLKIFGLFLPKYSVSVATYTELSRKYKFSMTTACAE